MRYEVYGLPIVQVEFLSIGDISSAKYRVVTKELAAYFLKLRKDNLEETSDEIRFIVERAEQLGKAFRSHPLERVLCHSDIHAGNLLLGTNGAVYLIDWDQPILAPKERDLMFIGGGVGGIWNTPREEALFYQGFGRCLSSGGGHMAMIPPRLWNR